MTATTARQYILFNVRNGSDTGQYSTTNQDLAIMAIGARLVEEAKVTRSVDEVDLVQDEEEVDFSAVSGFLPEYLIETGIRIEQDDNFTDSEDLESFDVVSMSRIARLKTCGTSSGTPRYIAFDISDNAIQTAIVYPAPDADGVLSVTWAPPFTSYTAGTASPGAVTLNIRDSILIEALLRGGPAYLQASQPEHAQQVALSEQRLVQWITTCKGKGNSGARVIHRTSARTLRDRGTTW